ncbi:hypothetical protein DdX_19461 [Ditylenchus destructor]|uniref:Uncharacterized protein n=1 Tax=Ditylenchus destructor TaxID=166010 RepID=A0AAD4QU71_9BILA|nr:hypothetical protein DdX_19461 [Ditylenchus destructor]
MNRSSVGGFLPPEYKRGRRNRTKDEPETMFDQRIKTENFDGLADYKASTQREIEDLRKALDFEIKHQCKTESELKLALGNLKDLFRDKGSTREIEELRKSLDTEIKQRRKIESELKVVWICCTLFVVAVLVLGLFCALELSSELKRRAKAEGELKLAQENLEGMRLDKEKAENAAKDLQNSLDAEIEQRRKTESELKLALENLEGMRRDKEKAENDLKRNLDALARH